MTTSEPLKLGCLGAGMIATVNYGYLPGLRHIPDKAVLTAISDPVVDRARDVAAAYGVDPRQVYADVDAMLAGADIDVLLNLTPIPLHANTTLKALRAGKHVVSEKPIATTMREADEIVDAARARDLVVVCAPPNMLSATRTLAKRLIADGAIGQVAFARVRSSHGGPAAGAWPADPTWFYQEGSGPLFDMGVYGIHDITGLLGPAKRVFAMSGITERERRVRGGPFKGKAIQVTADDNTLIMLDFGHSAFAVVDGTFNVNASRGPALEIFGRRGTLTLDSPNEGGTGAPPMELYKLDIEPGLDGWITPRAPELSQGRQREQQLQRAVLIEHLADCVRSGQHPVLSAEHARHALEIMIKGMEAARAGCAVELTTTF